MIDIEAPVDSDDIDSDGCSLTSAGHGQGCGPRPASDAVGRKHARTGDCYVAAKLTEILRRSLTSARLNHLLVRLSVCL